MSEKYTPEEENEIRKSRILSDSESIINKEAEYDGENLIFTEDKKKAHSTTKEITDKESESNIVKKHEIMFSILTVKNMKKLVKELYNNRNDKQCEQLIEKGLAVIKKLKNNDPLDFSEVDNIKEAIESKLDKIYKSIDEETNKKKEKRYITIKQNFNIEIRRFSINLSKYLNRWFESAIKKSENLKESNKLDIVYVTIINELIKLCEDEDKVYIEKIKNRLSCLDDNKFKAYRDEFLKSLKEIRKSISGEDRTITTPKELSDQFNVQGNKGSLGELLKYIESISTND